MSSSHAAETPSEPHSVVEDRSTTDKLDERSEIDQGSQPSSTPQPGGKAVPSGDGSKDNHATPGPTSAGEESWVLRVSEGQSGTVSSSSPVADTSKVVGHKEGKEEQQNQSEAVELHNDDHGVGKASAEESAVDSGPPPLPPPKDEKYLNMAGGTARASPRPDHETEADGAESRRDPPLDTEFNEKEAVEGLEDDRGPGGDDSKSEIQSIMGQFDEGMGGPGMEEIMSHRLEIASPVLHPPRHSSLEPSNTGALSPTLASPISEKNQSAFSHPRRTSSLYGPPSPKFTRSPSEDQPSSPKTSSTIFRPPPPDPDPDLPFDFHRFLEQLRHRTADPVAKFLRSFLLEFGKKQWMVHEQVKIISDFLEFISKKMATCEVWRTVSDAEFDNAREGMEKLVMNRLYNQTFSPAIPPPEPLPGRQARRKGAPVSAGPGRRGQHQEDVERDEVLAQKVRIYGWVTEEHLDIKPIGEKGRKFLGLAQQGMLAAAGTVRD